MRILLAVLCISSSILPQSHSAQCAAAWSSIRVSAVLLSSEWCCLASALLWKLPSIAFLHQRTNQAPRSRYTVALSRADSHHRPGRCDGGGTPENGGRQGACGCWIYGLLRGESPGCDEILIKVRHTQAHAHHKRLGLALQLCVFASLQGLKADNRRWGWWNYCLGEGDAHFTTAPALSDEEVRLHTRPFQPVDPAKKARTRSSDNTATDFINMRSLSDGRQRE